MDIGSHTVDAEDLSIAANAFDELVSIVEGIIERHLGNNDFETAESRSLIARSVVDAIVRRMSGVPTSEEEADE